MLYLGDFNSVSLSTRQTSLVWNQSSSSSEQRNVLYRRHQTVMLVPLLCTSCWSAAMLLSLNERKVRFSSFLLVSVNYTNWWINYSLKWSIKWIVLSARNPIEWGNYVLRLKVTGFLQNFFVGFDLRVAGFSCCICCCVLCNSGVWQQRLGARLEQIAAVCTGLTAKCCCFAWVPLLSFYHAMLCIARTM